MNLTQLARVLTGRKDVTVDFNEQGVSQTDTVGIHLVDTKDLPPRALHGLLDHELGHVLWSPKGGKEKLHKKLGKDAALLLNAIEDCRVNLKLLERWKGSRINLTAKSKVRPVDDALIEGLSDFSKLVAGVYVKMSPYYLPGAVDPTPLIKGYEDLIPNVKQLTSYQKSVKLTKRIFQRWKMLHPIPPPPEEEEGEQWSLPPGNEKPPPSPEREQKQEEKPQPKKDFEMLRVTFDPSFVFPKKEEPKGRKEIPGRVLIEAPPPLPDDNAYRVHPKAKTYIQPSVYENNGHSPALATNAAKLSLALTRDIESFWMGRQDTGKVSTKDLHRLLLPTPGFSIFRKKARAKELDAAVSILLDVSGSMGSAAVFLQQSFEVLTLALTRLQIPSETLTFSTEGFCLNVSGYWKGRDNDMYIDILKAFHESTAVGLSRQLCIRSGNPIGEAMLIAANRLLPRPERKKVLLVFTDGEPGNGGSSDYEGGEYVQDAYAKQVSTLIQNRGIVLLGVGLKLTRISDFCIPILCNLQHPEDLVMRLGESLMKHLQHEVIREVV